MGIRMAMGIRISMEIRNTTGIRNPPFKWGVPVQRGRDSNPRYGFPYTHFPGVLLQPLGHLSVFPKTYIDWSGGANLRHPALFSEYFKCPLCSVLDDCIHICTLHFR
jgi:hypothetical protein